MNSRRLKRSGFTLVELMIAISIIGILASIAIPKFADMVRRTQEGQTKGNLGAIRSAMSVFYADNEGQYPQLVESLSFLTVNGKYLTAIPSHSMPPYHPSSTQSSASWECGPPYPCINFGMSNELAMDAAGSMLGYTLAWFIDDDPQDANFGSVLLDCGHTDSKGSLWTSY